LVTINHLHNIQNEVQKENIKKEFEKEDEYSVIMSAYSEVTEEIPPEETEEYMENAVIDELFKNRKINDKEMFR
jgi:hypothetical protein